MKLEQVKKAKTSTINFQDAAKITLDAKQQKALKGGSIIIEDGIML